MSTETLKHYHEAWKPQEDICIVFDDKTADDRTPEQIDEMFERLRAVAGEYGFDINTWGSPKSMYRAFKRYL